MYVNVYVIICVPKVRVHTLYPIRVLVWNTTILEKPRYRYANINLYVFRFLLVEDEEFGCAGSFNARD